MTVMCYYSVSIWQMIDGYFQDRFKEYLRDEFQANRYTSAAYLNSLRSMGISSIASRIPRGADNVCRAKTLFDILENWRHETHFKWT